MFEDLTVGHEYSRPELADLWGYSSFHAIARGVITPRNTNFIILFVTEEKQSSQEQYQNTLKERVLTWEGPNDHFAEKRMISAESTGDEIHLFHRKRHHTDFTYLGKMTLRSYQLYNDRSSSFVFALSD